MGSTWVSVGLIGFMIAVLLIVIALVLFRPDSRYIGTKKVEKNPLTFILYTLSGSPGLMVWLHSLSELSTSQRNERVKALDLRYELVEVGYAEQEGFRPRIEVSSAAS